MAAVAVPAGVVAGVLDVVFGFAAGGFDVPDEALLAVAAVVVGDPEVVPCVLGAASEVVAALWAAV